MVDSIDKYRNLLSKTRENKELLDYINQNADKEQGMIKEEDVKNFTNSNKEDEVLNKIQERIDRAKRAQKYLDVMKAEGRVSAKAKENDQDENSDFNFDKTPESSKDALNQVMSRISLDIPEVSPKEKELDILAQKVRGERPLIELPQTEPIMSVGKPRPMVYNQLPNEDEGEAILSGTEQAQQALAPQSKKPLTAIPTSKNIESELEKAYREKRISDALALLSSGSKKIAAGMAGRDLTNIKVDDELSKYLKQEGQDKVTLAKEQEAAKISEAKADIDAKYKEALIANQLSKSKKTDYSDDANSEASKKAQEDLKALYKANNIQFDEDAVSNLSEDVIKSQNFNTAMRKTKNILDTKKEDRLVEKFGYSKKEKFEDDASKTLTTLRATDTWKSAEKTLSNIPTLHTLLDDAYTNGGQSLSMLGPVVSRAIAGEVGVLTDKDVTRYVKNPAMVQGLVDDIAKIKSGKIGKASYENIKRLLDISEKTARDKMQGAIMRESELFSRREGIPVEDARYLLDNTYQKQPPEVKKTDAPYGDEVTKDGKEYKWNPITGKYQLK